MVSVSVCLCLCVFACVYMCNVQCVMCTVMCSIQDFCKTYSCNVEICLTNGDGKHCCGSHHPMTKELGAEIGYHFLSTDIWSDIRSDISLKWLNHDHHWWFNPVCLPTAPLFGGNKYPVQLSSSLSENACGTKVRYFRRSWRSSRSICPAASSWMAGVNLQNWHWSCYCYFYSYDSLYSIWMCIHVLHN